MGLKILKLFMFSRAFAGNDPLKAWGQSGGGAGLTSKYLGEAGIQTYFEVSYFCV